MRRTIVLLLALIYMTQCQRPMESEHSNSLIGSTSPYLLQHAQNPVEWYPWDEEALAKAKEENKPIILSIGYSSCHWCHVMAHESFEDDSVAEIMNAHFINIKLDREERPDIDNLYMDAIQAMGLRGGWPLNVFLTPDQKPFYGGTYFPKENWMKLLESVNHAFAENRDKLNESAEQFAKALQSSQAAKYQLDARKQPVTDEQLQEAVAELMTKFDRKWGGINKAPKFPMPAVWQYLLQHGLAYGNEQLLAHVYATLSQIARGGIYDQIGGGFARYSVDGEWHVPHFEKMLYDNGQLLSLYANAYKITAKQEYLDVLLNTCQWISREMTHDNGGFYAALDADSEGVEGKYYVWDAEEFAVLAGENAPLLGKYYNVVDHGNWEGVNVLRRLQSDDAFCTKYEIDPQAWHKLVSKFNKKALDQRSMRVKPGLDNKLLAGWNGLALSGLLDAYQATGEASILTLAKKNAAFLAKNMISEGKLLRTYQQPVEGFLEDYGAVVQAFIKYYETTQDKHFLSLANKLTNRVVKHFYDKSEKLFYYTSDESENLIARKKEIFDNVIPSSNALMAENLHFLGMMLDSEVYKSLAAEMVNQASSLVAQEPEYMSYWSLVTMNVQHPTAEIIIVGDDKHEILNELHQYFLPNRIIMADKEGSQLPLFAHRTAVNGKSTIYLCFDKTCQRPVHSVDEMLLLLQRL